MKVSIFFYPLIITPIIFSFISFFSSKFNIFKTKEKVSFLGGLGIILSFFLSFFIFVFIENISLDKDFKILLLFSFLIFLIEFFDDLKEFDLKKKFILHIFFCLIFLIFAKRIQIYFFPSFLNFILSFLWIIGIMNAFNLLDIKDGLCSGVSLIVNLFFLFICILLKDYLLSFFFFSLFVSLSIFYIFNLPPAKMFMGNSGSHFLGFLFAGISMYIDYANLENVFAIFVPVLLLGLPILDTLFLILVRIKKRIFPFKKTQDHLFLRLFRKTNNYYFSLFLIYFLTSLWASSSIFLFLKKFLWFFIFFGLSFLCSLKVILLALT